MHVGSGDARKVWHLPEKLLRSNTTFFTAALEDGGISRKIRLPYEDPDIFQWFVVWLYVGCNQMAELEPDLQVHLWALGDRLGCPLMQDDAMCNLIEYDCHLGEVTLKHIYELSAPESKIRRFAIDQFLLHARQGCPHENRCSYLQLAKDNEDFAQQLTEAIILLGSEEPNDPYFDESPYLCAPSPARSRTRSGS